MTNPKATTFRAKKHAALAQFELGRKHTLYHSLRTLAENFWASRNYEAVLLAAAGAFLFLNMTLGGCIAMALTVSFMLVFCSDILAAFLPAFLFCLLTTGFFEDYGALLRHWPVFVIALAALAVHFVLYRAPICSGKMTRPLLAVSAAALLGGIGRISVGEYLAPTSVYYMIGLGVAMFCAYTLLLSQFKMKRNYDLLKRLLVTLYYTGLFAGLVIVNTYFMRFGEFLKLGSTIYISYRNFCATMMLLALPCVCVRSESGNHRYGGLLFIYGSLLMTGSRTGLFFGTLELSLCVVYMYRHAGEKRKLLVKRLLPVAVPAVCAIVFFAAKILFASRMIDGCLISPDDSRYIFFRQGIADFLEAPLFGMGLGNMKNSVIFLGVSGSMVWYHNLAAQILGSMGLSGALAYGWLYAARIKLLLTRRSAEIAVTAMSALGMLLVSLTNPGEFCPMPNALIMVALFAVAETLPERKTQ